jgi:hypothetical protein
MILYNPYKAGDFCVDFSHTDQVLYLSFIFDPPMGLNIRKEIIEIPKF